MNPLVNLIGKAVLGNLWSTSIGGSLIWANLERLLHLLASGPTVGQLVMAPEFQTVVVGAIAMVGKFDHSLLPQLFKGE